ncbi:GvpL/GvpF family gas vesicle protein [Streptomyces fragilis]|uniref:GvpL/GvpF family gas vesicle protein n=1 Tax=Streptomyces fragilis TaxID=67301 RepID=A0ABV2YCH9_9ACTN|nr:GvpL/GvpF family gas vesicle protein [Streptomyces fragilis]
MSTYVYGIASASHPSLPEGMGGVGDPPNPVRLLKEGDLVAVVGDAPEDLRPKRRDLLAHQTILAEAGAGGCVLPMRFGNVAPDDESVLRVLSERSGHYAERLRALDGKAEYNVKANHDEEAVLHVVMAEDAEVRSLAEANRQAGGGSHDDKLKLGEMVVGAVKAREEVDAAALQQALEPQAASVATGAESTGWITNLSFLVDTATADRFIAAVEQYREANPHVQLRVNGPLPPYSFVEPGPADHAQDGAGQAAGAAVE